MKRRYSMPSGAEFRDDGSVHFRLWARAARQVEFSPAGANRFSAALACPMTGKMGTTQESRELAPSSRLS
jgi:hypothetical protein